MRCIEEETATCDRLLPVDPAAAPRLMSSLAVGSFT